MTTTRHADPTGAPVYVDRTTPLHAARPVCDCRDLPDRPDLPNLPDVLRRWKWTSDFANALLTCPICEGLWHDWDDCDCPDCGAFRADFEAKADRTDRLFEVERRLAEARRLRRERLAAEAPDAEAPTLDQLTRRVATEPQPPLPAILTRDDGETVVYAGRFSSIHGEPGCGKSWAALIAATEAIRKRGRVLWLDYEDRPTTLATRARLLGALADVADTDALRFVDDHDLFEHLTASDEALAWLLQAPDATYSMVVIDSAESGGCPSDGADVAPWLRAYVDPWRREDIAVLLLDHVAKKREARGAIGSQHKRAKIDGAALLATGPAWDKATGGTVTLTNEKDRAGDLPGRIGQQVATIRGDYDANGAFGFRITPPRRQVADEDDTTATDDLDASIVAAIYHRGEYTSLAALAKAVGKRKAAVADAATRLHEQGRIIRTATGIGLRFTPPQDEPKPIELAL